MTVKLLDNVGIKLLFRTLITKIDLTMLLEEYYTTFSQLVSCQVIISFYMDPLLIVIYYLSLTICHLDNYKVCAKIVVLVEFLMLILSFF